LHARQRMAGAQGCFRTLARAGKFRRAGPAADELERVERRALDTTRAAGVPSPREAGRGCRAKRGGGGAMLALLQNPAPPPPPPLFFSQNAPPPPPPPHRGEGTFCPLHAGENGTLP